MSCSATELHITACCYLVEAKNWAAAMRLSSCILDYEEKNDTAFITITAPPDSYQMLKTFNNPIAMDAWIIPDDLEPSTIQLLQEDDIFARSIYRTLVACLCDLYDFVEGPPTILQINVKQASETTERQPQKPAITPPESSANNQCRQFDNTPVHTWENLRFRSHSEMRIAQALDRRNVLFFPNCAARLGLSPKRRENREADFLVCYEGKWGILEVDGPHGSAAEDHGRDRLFKQHGILMIEHFDSGECFENADGVVKRFLELLKKQK